MDIKTVLRDEFYICGYAAEATLENNDAVISGLYEDFFNTNKEKTLLDLPGCKPGMYGLEWYTEGHKSFYYLLGMEVGNIIEVPRGAILKRIPKAEYAVAQVPKGTSLIEAWTDFFYTAIPAFGYSPDEKHGFYFEYYPGDVHGECELWTPVIKK